MHSIAIFSSYMMHCGLVAILFHLEDGKQQLKGTCITFTSKLTSEIIPCSQTSLDTKWAIKTFSHLTQVLFRPLSLYLLSFNQTQARTSFIIYCLPYHNTSFWIMRRYVALSVLTTHISCTLAIFSGNGHHCLVWEHLKCCCIKEVVIHSLPLVYTISSAEDDSKWNRLKENTYHSIMWTEPIFAQ